jgi:hypothetical protein
LRTLGDLLLKSDVGLFKLLLGSQAKHFRADASGEDVKHRQILRLLGHRLVVHHGKVAKNVAITVTERDAEITGNIPLHQFFIRRKQSSHIDWVMASAALDDILTRSAYEFVLDVVSEPVSRPVGKRTHFGSRVCELGNKGISYAEGCSEMLNQRLEKLIAGISGCTFDKVPQKFIWCVDDRAP